MKHRAIATVLVMVLALVYATANFGFAQSGPPPVPDHLRAFSIVPPGQEGEVTLSELISGDYGAHYSDQLPLYANLVTDDDVTDDELATYFHSMQFGPGATVESTYSPVDGATVYRDNMGVPHIYADDLNKASFALGYVSAEDRMWQMDVFRHAARGTLAEFLGPGVDNAYINMDIATRREGYTPDEVRNMYDQWDDKFGALGDQMQGGLREYAAGINQYISELQSSPQMCSAEYQATGNPCPQPNPSEWNVSDTLFLVILQLRLFGETGGGELDNAAFYAHLQKQLGNKLGAKVYKDFIFQNDKKSPTTIPASQGRFPSQNLGKVNRKSFAVPDAAPAEAEEQQREQQQRNDTLRALGFPTGPMSNAMIVAPSESTSGNALQWGAPQVGYANPAFFMDIDVQVPSANVHYRGPAVPAASVLIPLGRGADYAWTLTTGYSDAVDTKVEKLCDPKGGEATQESEGYIYKGKCREMEKRDETFTIKQTPPPPGTQNPPGEETHTFYRTIHGPVFERGTVKGKPIALVKNRYFWKQELDSVAAFYKWNTQVRSIKDFRKAAREFSMNFNAFYADSSDIGWFHVGYLPTRPKGMHPSLPTWGTGKWEFGKRLPFKRHPQAINPEQGWIANWNNKPSVAWNNTDQCCWGSRKWGSVHRVSLLQDQMHELLDGAGKAELSDLVDVAKVAATQDARGVYLGPKMASWGQGALVAEDPKYTTALETVKTWITDGAHRFNKDDNPDAMDNSPALALFDEWWNQLIPKLYADELGEEGFEVMGVAWTDYSPGTSGGGGFFFDASSYVNNLFNKKAKKKLALDYCDNRGTDTKETCKQVVGEALKAAYDALVTAQGADMAAWELPPENIVFQELGAGAADPFPWQNRGTHNHIVEILEDGNLPPFKYPEPSPSGSGSPAPEPSGSASGSPPAP